MSSSGLHWRLTYELYLGVNDIDHTKTKATSPQTNGNCERFHKTILQEFYQITFRKKLYSSLEELQIDHGLQYPYGTALSQAKKNRFQKEYS